MTNAPSTVPAVGSAAPDFTLNDSKNVAFKLSEQRGKNVVLFFFPKAFTGTCESQIHTHSAEIEQFRKLDAEVVGISTDQGPALAAFSKGCDPEGHVRLLSDFRHRVVNLYGVAVAEGGLPNQRATFVIDKTGTVRYAFVEPHPGKWQGTAPEFEALRAL